MRLSHRKLNSLFLAFALAAPFVYLFGTLFSTLQGSAGEVVLADQKTEETVNYSVEYDDDTYTRLGYKNNQSAFMASIYESGVIKWGEQSIGFYGEGDVNFQENLPYLHNGSYWQLLALDGEPFLDGLDMPTGYYCWSFFAFLPEEQKYGYFEYFYYGYNNQNTTVWLWDNGEWQENTHALIAIETMWINGNYDYWTTNNDVAPDGFYNLPNDTNIPLFQPIIQHETNELTDYNEYLFGQMFTKDNYLSKSGKAVLEGTPDYGFEPLGELIRYTDQNMLHLANLSYGTLIIGYTYYAAHVIIVDLIFYIAAFLPRFIKKVVDKLEGGGI